MPDTYDIKRSIEQMPIDEITPIVRKAVGCESAVVKRGWAAEALSVVTHAKRGGPVIRAASL
jgi:hypothetical protein